MVAVDERDVRQQGAVDRPTASNRLANDRSRESCTGSGNGSSWPTAAGYACGPGNDPLLPAASGSFAEANKQKPSSRQRFCVHIER
jgi:hypothetical protein